MGQYFMQLVRQVLYQTLQTNLQPPAPEQTESPFETLDIYHWYLTALLYSVKLREYWTLTSRVTKYTGLQFQAALVLRLFALTPHASIHRLLIYGLSYSF
jgi:hypothetical protein